MVPNRLKAAWPGLLAAAILIANVCLAFNSARAGRPEFNLEGIRGGSFLLTGVYNQAVAGKMPFFDTLASLSLNLGLSPGVFFVLSYAGVCALVFSVGCLLSGYRAGIISLLAAGFIGVRGAAVNQDIEQTFYSFLLLLVMALFLLMRREKNIKSCVIAGLAVGISVLTRSPLFLFPLVVVPGALFSSGEARRDLFYRSLAFLAASYILLVPWGVLNYSVSGRFSLLDGQNSACNVITAASGSVYDMEGDCRKLAGIGPEASAFYFFLREFAADPLFYAGTVLKRLWHIFLFNPVLFGITLLALPAARGRELRLAFLLPAYFIFIHSLLSIEKRYFYPMPYLLIPLVAAVVFQGRPGSVAVSPWLREKTIYCSFWLSFCAVLAIEALALAYPVRAVKTREGYGDLSLALKRFPNDRVIQEMGCAGALAKGDYAGFYGCLGAYSARFDDKFKDYFLRARASVRPAELALPSGLEMKCLIIRMLREYELGVPAAAAISLKLAREMFETQYNALRGEPYARDKEVARRIRSDRSHFWERYVYNSLLLWPPEGMAKIISGIEKQNPLTMHLKMLNGVVKNAGARGAAGSEALCGWIAAELSGYPSGEKGALWRAAAKESKSLSDLAVIQLGAGRLKAAEALLLRSAALAPANPEVFMNLCGLRLRQNKKEQALEACQNAASAVYFNQENLTPPFKLLAADATRTARRLLKELGRE